MPLGTIIRNLDQEIICDLSTEGSMFVAAKGGSGGKGNASFKGHADFKLLEKMQISIAHLTFVYLSVGLESDRC